MDGVFGFSGLRLRAGLVSTAVALVLFGMVGAVDAPSASAATPSCGVSCINLFQRQFGPKFVLDASGGGLGAVGQPIILSRASKSDPAEDFTVSTQGLVSDFFAAGLVSAAVDLHYGGSSGGVDLSAFELEYSPFGVDSGLCVGVVATSFSGEGVTLQPCGVSSNTVWIMTSGQSITSSYTALINGSDTNFTDPFVLTARPGRRPVGQLFTTNLATGRGSQIRRQEWSALQGVLR